MLKIDVFVVLNDPHSLWRFANNQIQSRTTDIQVSVGGDGVGSFSLDVPASTKSIYLTVGYLIPGWVDGSCREVTNEQDAV